MPAATLAEKFHYNYDLLPAGYYYHAMLRERSVQGFWHRRKFGAVQDRVPANAHVLDFGCGPGAFLDLLANSHPGITAIGVDCAAAQIEFATRNIQSKHSSRLQFQQIAPTSPQTDFPDAFFDVVTLIEVIEHMTPAYAQRVLQEAARVLRPGGKLVVTTPNYRSWWPALELCLEPFRPFRYRDQHINKLTPQTLTKAIVEVGFDLRSLSTIFVLSPFLAPFSERFGNLLFAWEARALHPFGNVIVAEAIRELPCP